MASDGSSGTEADFEEAKAFLQREEGGSSVYEHLSEVLLKLLVERPESALSQLEHVSGLVKAGAYPALGAGQRAASSADAEARREAEGKRLASALALFAAPGEDEEVGEIGEGLQDVSDAATYLEWGGVSLGREETFRFYLALKQLAASSGASNLRLWGKLLGREGDYWVAEGKAEAAEEEEDEKDALGHVVEKTGEGVNTYTYWVCSRPGEAWVRLPRATPHQVLVARSVRRFLTGRLDAEVGGHPPFPGNEAAFVRSVIAVISAETVLAPAGYFRVPEDAEDGAQEVEVTPVEEFEAPDLSAPDGWVHAHLKINGIGRCNPDPKDDEGGEEEDEEVPEGAESSVPLASVADDAEGGDGGDEDVPWGFRNAPVSGIPEPEPGLVVARSLKWPGAVSVAFGRRFANVYVGYGVSKPTAPFQPKLPDPVAAEFDVATFNPAAEGATFEEQTDVTQDPDAGKPPPGDDDEDAEEDD